MQFHELFEQDLAEFVENKSFLRLRKHSQRGGQGGQSTTSGSVQSPEQIAAAAAAAQAKADAAKSGGLSDWLAGFNKDLPGVQSQLQTNAGILGAAAQGEDPLIASQRNAALNANNDAFAREGVFGSSSLAANNATRSQYDLSALGMRNSELAQQGDTLQGLLGNDLATPTTNIAYAAAKNQAKGGGGGATVICTLYFLRGDLDEEIWHADVAYGREVLGEQVLKGYHRWAKPWVEVLKRSPRLYFLGKPLVRGWATEMAFRRGKVAKGSIVGKALLFVGVPLCRWLGK